MVIGHLYLNKRSIIASRICETDSPSTVKTIHSNTVLEKSYLGENGSEVILSTEQENKYKNEISRGWKDYAFNEYVSSLISLGKY